MALDIDISHYNTGTATVAANGTVVTGQGTTWTVLRKGDMFGTHVGDGVRILSVDSNTQLTLAHPWPGVAQTAAAYEIQRTPYDVGYLEAIETLLRRWGGGNVDALSVLLGAPGMIPIFTGPGAMELVPRHDLTSGVNVNAKVENLAGRSAYDGESSGFSVLVGDIGDGRSAIYYKLSATSGDWSAPAYLTGPVGPVSTVPGVVWRGAYSGGVVYAINDGVTFNGSSFRKLTTIGSGNAPSSATPPVNNANWEVLAAKGIDGTGIGDVVGPSLSADGEEAIFSGATGKAIRSAGPSDPFLSVSPIPINLHFGILQGVGMVQPEQGVSFSTTTTAASVTNVITVASAANWRVGQLICYEATDGQYYSAIITVISGTTFTLDQTLPVGVASGAGVYAFYENSGHPTLSGYRAVADGALRQMRSAKTLAYLNADGAQWSTVGAGITLTPQTSAYYGNPGSMAAGQQSVLVQGTGANTGVKSLAVQFDSGGTYETEVVVNPGNVSGGASSGLVDVAIVATYPDGTSGTLASVRTAVFGNTARIVTVRYRVRRGTRIAVQVTEPTSGTWLFVIGMLRHYRVEDRLRSLNKGKHVLLGDSWIATGEIVARLQARLPLATFVNKGVGSNKISDLLARFNDDVVAQAPNFVWVLGGINDVVAVTPTATTAYLAGVDELISRIQSLSALPIVFDCQTGSINASQAIVSLSREYAIGLVASESEPNAPEIGTYLPEYLPATGAFGAISYNAIRAGSYIKYADGTAFISITMRTDSISLGTASGLLTVSMPFPVFQNNILPIRALGFANSPSLSYATNTDRLSLIRVSAGTETFSAVSDLNTGASANTLIVSGVVRWK